jgi:hypothetical protein
MELGCFKFQSSSQSVSIIIGQTSFIICSHEEIAEMSTKIPVLKAFRIEVESISLSDFSVVSDGFFEISLFWADD